MDPIPSVSDPQPKVFEPPSKASVRDPSPREVEAKEAITHEVKMNLLGASVVTIVSWTIGVILPKSFAVTYFTVIFGIIGFLTFLDEHEYPDRQSRKTIAIRGGANVAVHIIGWIVMAAFFVMFPQTLDKNTSMSFGQSIRISTWDFLFSIFIVTLIISLARTVTFVMVLLYRTFVKESL